VWNGDSGPQKAIDGFIGSGDCFVADYVWGGPAWWMVDLGDPHVIYSVFIYTNGMDGEGSVYWD
jgi:hypothetical protein